MHQPEHARALQLEPRLANANFNRALCYLARGEDEAAEADLEEALRRDPSLRDEVAELRRSMDR